MNNYSFTFPLKIKNPYISSGFGERKAPTKGASTFHSGIDIPVPVGTNVLAAFSGTVVKKGSNATEGNYMTLRHSNGVETNYKHLSSFIVPSGATVQEGQPIAKSGNSGVSTGPHLHFEILQNGKTVDPMKFNTKVGGLSIGNAFNGGGNFLKDKWWVLALGLVALAVIK